MNFREASGGYLIKDDFWWVMTISLRSLAEGISIIPSSQPFPLTYFSNIEDSLKQTKKL